VATSPPRRSATREQRDPLAPRAALRGGWPPAQLRFSGILFSGMRNPVAGERWRSGVRGER